MNILKSETKDGWNEFFVKKIQAEILKDKEYYIQRLQKFIAQPSVSLTKDGCDKIIDLAEREFKREKFDNLRKNSILSLKKHTEINQLQPILTGQIVDPESKSSPILLFMGHLDTQPADAENWKINPFKPIIKNDKLFGRGALDTKGQVSALISAIEILNKLDIPFWQKGGIKFFFNTDEEVGSAAHSLPLTYKYPELLKANALVNCENTNERIILGCKGILMLKFTAETLKKMHSGKSAFLKDHPVFTLSQFFSDIRRGQDLILPALKEQNPEVRVVDQINPFSNPNETSSNVIDIPKNALLKAIPQEININNENIEKYAELYAGLSFNINSFHAGLELATTSVPQSAYAKVDIRIPVGVSIQKILDILKEQIILYPNLNLEVIMPEPQHPEYFSRYNAVYTSPNSELVKILWGICKNNDISPVISPFSSGTSDERLLPKNIPHVKFGAKGANNHAPNEYIFVSSYLKMIKIYTELILRYFKIDKS